MNGYDLSRNWFDFCFENPEKITPNHTALYFFCIEHCNRLGWKQKFGLPTTMAKEAIGIRSYNTYIKTLNDLIDFGFIKMIEKSKNQYSSNIIALSNFNKALDKALDKALIKHTTKQVKSTRQSIDSINKQETINKETNIIYNSFYDEQIKLSNNNESYIKIVEILFGDNNLKTKLNSILKLELQLTFEQAEKILWYKNKYNISITSIFEEMENWVDLKKKKTVYKTFLTFMKNKYKNIKE